jgi:hypothetical protein
MLPFVFRPSQGGYTEHWQDRTKSKDHFRRTGGEIPVNRANSGGEKLLLACLLANKIDQAVQKFCRSPISGFSDSLLHNSTLRSLKPPDLSPQTFQKCINVRNSVR